MNDYKRRVERANVKRRLKGVYLRCDVLNKKEIRVLNISEYGLGVATAEVNTIPDSKKILDAKIVIGITPISVKIAMVRTTPEITGFEIIDPPALVTAAIRKFFEAEILGASMRAIGSVDPDATNTTISFSDQKTTKLVAQIKEGEIYHLSIAAFGIHFEWDHIHPIHIVQNERKLKVKNYQRKALVEMVRNLTYPNLKIVSEIERILLTE
ncbi:MAG: hypothetical protein CL678_05160 [Bdellovibrionaceae bacterium]|nr:hypothetical protein [Pseudobdellovibrionaceae bacterium]|tara:strand:- start:2113 stop:2745 length:633 start_codon:yes stop_codon:yes gene_type:complete